MLHESHFAAEAALMLAANIDDAEVSRIFESVDSRYTPTPDLLILRWGSTVAPTSLCVAVDQIRLRIGKLTPSIKQN